MTGLLGWMTGREEGREEGEAEGLTKVAKKMKSMGMSMDTICEATGLLAEKVAEL